MKNGEPFVLGPPQAKGPVVVEASFVLRDINEINDDAETFEITGVLTFRWRDPRQGFDPVAAGVDEKIFQGNFQFNEISPGWYPQVVLVNESGLNQASGVVLRVRPDGTSLLVQTINAVVESPVNMRRFPFDGHRLEAIFEVLGFDVNEVVLRTPPGAGAHTTRTAMIPQWELKEVGAEVRDWQAPHAGAAGISSAFVAYFDVQRKPLYIIRLVVLPLVVIALLSFSIFWMDRSSIGDRLSVSFTGILTGVAYLLVTSEQLPRISYFTLVHGFLNMTFLAMCATVLVTLRVAVLDKRGHSAAGDRLDRRCRVLFPLLYFGCLGILLAVALVLFDPDGTPAIGAGTLRP